MFKTKFRDFPSMCLQEPEDHHMPLLWQGGPYEEALQKEVGLLENQPSRASLGGSCRRAYRIEGVLFICIDGQKTSRST